MQKDTEAWKAVVIELCWSSAEWLDRLAEPYIPHKQLDLNPIGEGSH
jgi:hypothetical protein